MRSKMAWQGEPNLYLRHELTAFIEAETDQSRLVYQPSGFPPPRENYLNFN